LEGIPCYNSRIMAERTFVFLASVRTAFLLLVYAVLILIAIPILIVCVLAGVRDPLIAYGKWAMRVSRVILGIKVEVLGREHARPGVPVVYMPNHQSFLDGPLIEMVLPVPARIILKKGVFGIPVVGIAMQYVGFIPVDRKGAQGGKKSVGRAAQLMRKRGYSFLVFPEGTRTRDGTLQAFRRGGFFLALESGAPIVPITIKGTFALMPRGQWYARRGRIQVIFHEAIPVAGYTVETMPALIEKVRAALAVEGTL
jgi:1-acyl-sn-glycerol-3-phosphate acyltransferase